MSEGSAVVSVARDLIELLLPTVPIFLLTCTKWYVLCVLGCVHIRTCIVTHVVPLKTNCKVIEIIN